MTWENREATAQHKKYHKIHCFTCKKDILRKSELVRGHVGHSVHYVDKDGKIDE